MKETWVLYVYTILTMITALAIAAIDEKLLWLQLILFTLNIGLYGLVAFMLVFKTGEEAAKLRHANDIKRPRHHGNGRLLRLQPPGRIRSL